jgi:ubiquinone/menaquinone biosynthesis C-methylase UbiE
MTAGAGRATLPELYERWLVAPLFRPWVDEVFDAVALQPDDRVLDVGCGTGIVARVARERLGPRSRVTGIDINPGMLDVARSVAPAIDWREGDVRQLPLRPGERFDVVVCQQGVQFFPDKPAAVASMASALADGGRLALLTWRPLSETPFFHELNDVVERHLGPFTDTRHNYGESQPLADLLDASGLKEVGVTTLARTIRFENPTVLLRLNTMAVLGMIRAARQMDEPTRTATLDRIVADSAGVVARYADGPGVAFAIATNLAIGRS